MKALNLFFRREFIFVFSLLILGNIFQVMAQESPYYKTFDFYYSRSQEKSFNLDTRKILVYMASRQLPKMADDSLKYWRLSKIAVAADVINDSILFKTVSADAFSLANKLNKANLQGDVHWNYGAHYLKQKEYDSSYFHYDRAYKIYSSINDNYYSGKMLYNMAYIASQVHDYTGAEIHLYRAIEYFEREEKHKQLYLCFNLLGTIAENLGELKNANTYYNKAAEYISNIEEPRHEQIELWNNMGLIFHKLENYEEAITYFNKGLEEEGIKNDRPSLYAKLLDNKAYSQFSMGKEASFIDAMIEALFIRDSIGDAGGSVINRIHLAKYYAKEGDTILAINYAKVAFYMASENQLNRDILQSLELLAILDLENKAKYLQDHIDLNNSLNIRERSVRNKFTAIRYETEKYIIENEKLFKERYWIIASAFTITLILLLIYWNTRQRARNKELLFETEQQRYNEDMFLLALENKTTLERGRNEERLRISEELHDGILARLFSVRFRWGFLKLSGHPENLEEHKRSLAQLTDIESDIRNISHDLRNELIWNEMQFVDEIKHIVKEQSELGNFSYSFRFENYDEWEGLDYFIKINISRMLTEIFQNILKHADATKVQVNFIVMADEYVISVEDNGKGFRPYFIKEGIGLKNLKNRSRKLNGKVTVKSEIGLGSITTLSFPKK